MSPCVPGSSEWLRRLIQVLSHAPINLSEVRILARASALKSALTQIPLQSMRDSIRHGTGDKEDALRIDRSTTTEEVREYVEGRVKEPLELEDGRVRVWNFTTHKPDMAALEEKSRSLPSGDYLIPYQVPGVWGYMQDLIPEHIRERDLLVYSKQDGCYKLFPNFKQRSNPVNDEIVKAALDKELEEMHG